MNKICLLLFLLVYPYKIQAQDNFEYQFAYEMLRRDTTLINSLCKEDSVLSLKIFSAYRNLSISRFSDLVGVSEVFKKAVKAQKKSFKKNSPVYNVVDESIRSLDKSDDKHCAIICFGRKINNFLAAEIVLYERDSINSMDWETITSFKRSHFVLFDFNEAKPIYYLLEVER